MIHLLKLKNVPIFQQLEIEEALLRTDDKNWCILNHGSSKAIVIGISGKPEELVDIQAAKKKNVLMIKRFSGGGTVVVDEDTLFSSFIFEKDTFAFPPFPEHILKWSANFYKKALNIENFALKENDYTLGEKKCAGNAQYLKKGRWLHHTTFLYDYQQENMDLLLYPKKTPAYRSGRSHKDFLCHLKPYLKTKDLFETLIEKQLKKLFEVKYHTLEDIKPYLLKEHRKSLHVIDH